jgi:hypothetical protein
MTGITYDVTFMLTSVPVSGSEYFKRLMFVTRRYNIEPSACTVQDTELHFEIAGWNPERTMGFVWCRYCSRVTLAYLAANGALQPLMESMSVLMH